MLLDRVNPALGFISSCTPASSKWDSPSHYRPACQSGVFHAPDHLNCLRYHLLLFFLESFPLCFILTPDVQMFCSVWGLCPLFFVQLLCPFPLHGVIMLTIMCNAHSFHWFIYRNFSGLFFWFFFVLFLFFWCLIQHCAKGGNVPLNKRAVWFSGSVSFLPKLPFPYQRYQSFPYLPVLTPGFNPLPWLSLM